MRNRLSLLLLMVMSLTHPFVGGAVAASPTVVITHVTVIDVIGGVARPDMTVVIKGNRITALGKEGEVKVPQGAQIIDATGKYLIPGLWDMHVHLIDSEWSDTYLSLLIVNGITGVRDMGSNDTDDETSREVFKRWRKETAKGRLLAPHIFTAEKIVNDSLGPSCIKVGDEAEGRQAVRKLKHDGANFVKVWDFLRRDAYFAIMDEAKKQGLPVVGHVPISITVAEASDAGQKSIEHLAGFLYACSTSETELRKPVIEILNISGGPFSKNDMFRGLRGRQHNTFLSTYSEKKAADLFARLKRNGTWQVPTLVAIRYPAPSKDPNLLNDPRLRYVPYYTKKRWDSRISSQRTNDQMVQAEHQKYVEIVGALNRANVPLLAATDSPVPYIFPGFSLHDELALFVQAGLTPVEALRTATINPAKYFNLEKTLGTVETGKLADLVLLDANPLADIGNTRKIAAVVLGGRYLPRERLQKMLADVEAIANKQ